MTTDSFMQGLPQTLTVNIDTQEGAKFINFSDGQPSVRLDPNVFSPGAMVQVVCSMTSPQKVLQMMAVKTALIAAKCELWRLVIPYLMGARSDRVMEPGSSFDLQWAAMIINAMNAQEVVLFDVHSDTALALIAKATHYTNENLVQAYDKDEAVLVVPDAGAAKKVHKYLDLNPNIKDVVYSIKTRELATGRLTLKVLEPDVCKDRNVVIIDDICDGGATFIAIAQQIRPAHLTLIVTHGIFAKGFEALSSNFNQIITSDSIYKDKGDWPGLVTVIPHNLAL